MLNFFRYRVLPSRFVQLFMRTGQKWIADQCLEMGAAISYYAIFSLFPIIIVILSVAGFFLGPDTDVMTQILTYAETYLPPTAFGIIQDVLMHLNESSIGAGVVGFVLLLFTASSVFGALDRSVDRIWNVSTQERENVTVRSQVLTLIYNRIVAFALVISTAILMTLSLLSNIALKTIRRLITTFNELITFIDLDEVSIIRDIQVIVTLVILFLVILSLFKILPSTTVKWSDLWLGSLITAGLLVLLQMLVSNSVISIGSHFRSYGVIGGVMVLMLWLYWTCQVFFIGCEFSYVYAHLFGSRRRRREKQDALPTDSPGLGR